MYQIFGIIHKLVNLNAQSVISLSV